MTPMENFDFVLENEFIINLTIIILGVPHSDHLFACTERTCFRNWRDKVEKIIINLYYKS